MDGGGVKTVGPQALGDDVHLGLAVAEDNSVLDPFGFDEHPQGGPLGLRVGGRQPDNVLGDGLGGGGRPCDLDPHGIIEELLGQPGDLGRHGRREEQGLLPGRRQTENPLDIGNEAHVEHAVRLVDDQDLDAGQQQLAALKMVKETARGGDQDVDAAVQLQFLVAEGDAPDQEGPGELAHLACGIAFKGGGNLVGQLPGRGDDKGSGHPRPAAAGRQAFDHRQGEGRGLARAGLGDAQDVPPGQGDGDGLGLDGGCGGVAGVGDGLQDFRGQAQFREFGHYLPKGRRARPAGRGRARRSGADVGRRAPRNIRAGGAKSTRKRRRRPRLI